MDVNCLVLAKRSVPPLKMKSDASVVPNAINNFPVSMIAPDTPESAIMLAAFRETKSKLEAADEQKLVPCMAV